MSFNNIPDEIIVEIIRNHIDDDFDVFHCYVLCKRFHRLIKNHCKDKLAGPHYWFWKSIQRMHEQENQQFLNSKKLLNDCSVRISNYNPQQPAQPTKQDSKKNLFQKIKNMVGSKSTEDPPRQKVIVVKPPRARKKVLLLGAGCQGKSTFMKQIRLLSEGGFQAEEVQSYSGLIHSNTLGWLKTISNQVYPPESSFQKELEAFSELAVNASQLPPILKLWDEAVKDKNFMKAMQWTDSKTEPQHRVGTITNCLYLMKERQRILQSNYQSTILDVLISRAKTTGIVELEFSCGSELFSMLDTGGERSERRKWIHCFQDVNMVLFVLSLADYDMLLFEDHETNRMAENLALLKEIVQSKWFHDCPVVTIFSQQDIFKDKVRSIPISKYFPEYEGPNKYQEGFQFFADKCLKFYNDANKKFYHVTVTTIDTESVCNAWLEIMKFLEDTNLLACALD